MKVRAHRLVGFAFLILGIAIPVRSQDLRKQAEDHPLSTVFYLLSTRDADDKRFGKEGLAVSYSRAGRYREVKKLAGLLKPDDVGQTFAELADQMLREGFVAEGTELVNLLIEKFDDEYRLKMLIRPLIRINRDGEAASLFDKLDESDQIDGSIELAKVYLELGRPQDALRAIERIDPMVGRSKFDEDKAELALLYANLGEADLALKWMKASRANLAWTSDKPEYSDGRILDNAVETLRVLGRNQEANDLLLRQGKKLDEPENQLDIARRLFRSGKPLEAKAILERLQRDPDASEWSYLLIDVYTRLNEPDKAAALLRKSKGDAYGRQNSLAAIVDLYTKRKEKTKALDLLSFALRETEKMDISEPEDGRMSTSPKLQQAQYQAQIALRYGGLNLDNQAADIIRKLKKPYLRARTLTEYVMANKRLLSTVQQHKYLEEAVSLLREKETEIFDSNKFEVYGVTALAFAEIGLKPRSNEIFAQALVDLDNYILEDGIDSTLINFLNNLGVNFEKARIKPSDDVRNALRRIIKNWDEDEY